MGARAVDSCKAPQFPSKTREERAKNWRVASRTTTRPKMQETDQLRVEDRGKRRQGHRAKTTPMPPTSKCSKNGEDCSQTRCCVTAGMQCYEKNTYFASCNSTCRAGIHVEDPIQKHWSCRQLGGRRPVSLFCFSVMRTSGYELKLVRSQLRKGASIFGCDFYAVYSDRKTWLSPGPPTRIDTSVLPGGLGSQNGVPGALTSTWVNTECFMRAWAEVIKDGRYLRSDWVVKLDPDAVFFPARLRERLAKNIPNIEGPGAYVKNCEHGPRGLGLFGSIEILSSSAVRTYAKEGSRCKTDLHYSGWGEDFFMQKCLDLLGVQSVRDYDLLRDGYCTSQSATCDSATVVAFHPFKTPESYFQCWYEATA